MSTITNMRGIEILAQIDDTALATDLAMLEWAVGACARVKLLPHRLQLLNMSRFALCRALHRMLLNTNNSGTPCDILCTPARKDTDVIYVCVRDTGDATAARAAATSLIARLRDDEIQGISGVRESYVVAYESSEPEPGRSISRHFRIDTLGINMSHALSHPLIDQTRTTCNDVHSIAKIFGIEAAHAVLFSEFSTVLGSGVHARHILVMVDFMVHEGFINAVNRHGMARTSASALQASSFEETIETVTGAAAFNEFCRIRGITEQIVTGAPVTIGTGSVFSKSATMPFVGCSSDSLFLRASAIAATSEAAAVPATRPHPTVRGKPAQATTMLTTSAHVHLGTPPSTPPSSPPPPASSDQRGDDDDYFEFDNWAYTPRSPPSVQHVYAPRSPYIPRSPRKRTGTPSENGADDMPTSDGGDAKRTRYAMTLCE